MNFTKFIPKLKRKKKNKQDSSLGIVYVNDRNINGMSFNVTVDNFSANIDIHKGLIISEPVKKLNAFKSVWRGLIDLSHEVPCFNLEINEYIGSFGCSYFLMNKVEHLVLYDFRGAREEMFLFRSASIESFYLNKVTFQFSSQVNCSIMNIAIIAADLSKHGIRIEGERNKSTTPGFGALLISHFTFALSSEAMLIFVKLLMKSRYRSKQWNNQLCSIQRYDERLPVFHQLRTSLYLSTYPNNDFLSVAQTEAFTRLEPEYDNGFLRGFMPRLSTEYRKKSLWDYGSPRERLSYSDSVYS